MAGKLKLTKLILIKIKELHENGMGAVNIAKQLNLAPSTIVKSYQKLGITDTHEPKTILNKYKLSKIKELYELGLNETQISKELKCSINIISKAFKKLQINLKSSYKINVLTNEINSKILTNLFNCGLSIADMSKKLNFSERVIRLALEKLNLELNKRPKKYSAILLTEKKCSKCQCVKSVENFRKHFKKDHFYYHAYCRDCDLLAGYESRKKKTKNDPSYKLRVNISSQINAYLTNKNSNKDGKSILDYLPYTINELKLHLESQFEWWMTWENHGKYIANLWSDDDPKTWKWQLDHIIPHSEFKYLSLDDALFQECWSLNNLRPLSAKQNVLDGMRKTRHKRGNNSE